MIKKLMAVFLAALAFAQSATAQVDAKRAARDTSFLAFVEKLKATPTQIVDYSDLLAAAKGRKLVVLGGYSGLGYENPPALREHIKNLMKAKGSGTMYVIGATADGIGAAYKWIPELAAELKLTDIKTAGIVSRNAWEYGIEPQDYVVFVDTAVDDWNVKVDGRSLMVNIASDTKGQLVYFRGGAVSRAELEEALARNINVVIVNDEATMPNKKNVEKKTAANPNYVVDGTAPIVSEAAKYPSLKVVQNGVF
jgi:hypothetical protein